ncbi:MAG TPA: LptA/OstA family protein [Edaphobacter sp.]|nr:LptA/OstA family protein [Edaphobacter sp.]
MLAGAGLLVVVIAAFLGYAHYRANRFLTELPAKLGADIRQETNSFTYSQSMGGKTIYTIHAAKALQHKNGKYTLHDVGIVVYGRKSDRADRIYGSEFEYDPKEGVAQAMGEVQLDLQAPAPEGSEAQRKYAAGGSGTQDSRMIHVRTSGLVFMQKLGVAATDQAIEFQFNGMTGHAMGADYDSDTGVVVLHSNVEVKGVEQGQPVMLTASRAELDRPNKQTVLTQAKYVRGGTGEEAEAGRAVIHMRDDGSAERLDAEGAVTLSDGHGGTVGAPRGEVLLNAKSQPKSAVLSGGLRYVSNEKMRQARGEAAEAKAIFSGDGRLQHVSMTGGVNLHEQVRTTDAATARWSTRNLTASALDLSLTPNRNGKPQLQLAKTIGNAHLSVTNPEKSKSGKSAGTSSDLSADVLTAHFAPLNGGAPQLSVVNGAGHTVLRQVNSSGAVNTSSGDAVEAHFKPTGSRGGTSANEIASAVQEGNVVLTQTSAKQPGKQDKATAARAVYDGASQKLTLTGDVQLTDGQSVLWASRVVMAQATGDAEADGEVKASYRLSENNGEPVHVLASRAVVKQASGVATFYGAAGASARLWQGSSQVEAPEIEFDRKEKELIAQGSGQGTTTQVRTVLMSGGATPGKSELVRVLSRKLTYSDAARRAEFTGGVEVVSKDGRMTGQQAVIDLAAAAKNSATPRQKSASNSAKTSRQAGFMGGEVERIVASGHIEINQPGRRATGEKVVYTAKDGTFVMTGTATAPPKVVDDLRGTVTGASLRFRTGDESIVVSNESPNGTAGKQRVRTETHVRKD